MGCLCTVTGFGLRFKYSFYKWPVLTCAKFVIRNSKWLNLEIKRIQNKGICDVEGLLLFAHV